jgi:hypothetical protein
MASKRSNFDYVFELHIRCRRLGIKPTPKVEAYEHAQDGNSTAIYGGLRLYGARLSLLGREFDSRDLYRTRKEAKNSVASRAVDFLEVSSIIASPSRVIHKITKRDVGMGARKGIWF